MPAMRSLLTSYSSIGALALIGLIGSQCCKCAAKLDILHGRTVNLHRMTGWLRPSDIATCIWKLRRLPGGLGLGIMMVIVSILTLFADLAVNILVTQSPQQGICDFQFGLVINWTDEAFVQPPANSYPAQIALNAQFYSYDNNELLDNPDCQTGIFRKIPWAGNVTFCANEYDVMGTWHCRPYGSNYSFGSDADVDSIGDFLYNHGLQYRNWSTSEYTQNDTGVELPAHLVVWSSSDEGDASNSSFSVLASVDLNGTYMGTKIMETYQCNVISNSPNEDDLNHIEEILKTIPGNDTLYEWAPKLETILYMGDGTNVNDNADLRIAFLLNALTMVQGGSNSVLNYPLENDYPGFGCILNQTKVSPVILALIAFTGFCLLTITFYWFTLLFRLGRHALPSFLRGKNSHIIKPVPDSILGWMLQASRENVLGSQTVYGDSLHLASIPKKEQELQGWSFGVADTGAHVARMIRTHGAIAPQMVEQVYMGVDQK